MMNIRLPLLNGLITQSEFEPNFLSRPLARRDWVLHHAGEG